MGDKPLLLDGFSGAGGCSEGYRRAGFDVIGIDIEPIRHYVDPKAFFRGDMMNVLAILNFGGSLRDAISGAPDLYMSDFAAMHLSPPCQGYSVTKRFNPHKTYPKLIEPCRAEAKLSGLRYVIENVEEAPLYARVNLCGGMFPDADLRTYRHRLFETNFHIPQPIHQPHLTRTVKMGRVPAPGEFMHVVGHFPAMDYARKAMGIGWMNRDELAEAVPPAYTEYVGKYLMQDLLN